MKSFLFFLTFFLINPSSSFLNSEELKIALDLANQLNIRHCIFVSEDTSISNVKVFSSDKIFTTYYGYNYTAEFVFYDINVFYKTGIILKIRDLNYLKLVSKKLDVQVYYIDGLPYAYPGSMSLFTWVVFLEGSKFQYDFAVPYDCEFLTIQNLDRGTYKLTEFYTAKNKSFFRDFGMWRDQNLTITPLSMYQRRLDLNGTTIINHYILKNTCGGHRFSEIPPFCVLDEIVEEFSKMMNFVNWRVNSIREKLKNRSLDTKPDILTVATQMESSVIRKCTIGLLFQMKLNWYIKQRGGDLRSDYFLQPFEIRTWFPILAGIIIIGSLTLIAMQMITQRYERRPANRYTTDNLFMCFEILCNQNGGENMKDISLRLVGLAISSVAIIVFNSFGATITSFLAVEIPDIPFTNIKEFADNGEFKLLTMNAELLRHGNSRDYTIANFTQDFVVEVPESKYYEEIKKICHQNLAIVSYDNLLNFQNFPCNILKLPKPFKISTIALFTSFNSPFLKVFNHNFIRFFEYGIQKRMQKFVSGTYKPTIIDKGIKAIEIKQMEQVLAIPFLGILAALAMIICEFVWRWSVKMLTKF